MATSNEARLTVLANQSPTAAITQPVTGTLYSGGQTINFSGTGTDPEDGTLPASAFTWRIDFHHDDHTHPSMQPTSGITSGSFFVPTTGETSANVFYRIHLMVRDSGLLQHSVFRDVNTSNCHDHTHGYSLGTSSDFGWSTADNSSLVRGSCRNDEDDWCPIATNH